MFKIAMTSKNKSNLVMYLLLTIKWLIKNSSHQVNPKKKNFTIMNKALKNTIMILLKWKHTEKVILNIQLALWCKRLLIHLLVPPEMKMDLYYTLFQKRRWSQSNWMMRNTWDHFTKKWNRSRKNPNSILKMKKSSIRLFIKNLMEKHHHLKLKSSMNNSTKNLEFSKMERNMIS